MGRHEEAIQAYENALMMDTDTTGVDIGEEYTSPLLKSHQRVQSYESLRQPKSTSGTNVVRLKAKEFPGHKPGALKSRNKLRSCKSE